MRNKTGIKSRLIDRWICSEDEELLEREGATQQGIKIIDELNRVYQRTGVLNNVIQIVGSEAQRIHADTNRPVKILEIGMRDGNLMRQIAELGIQEEIPLDLHGVEFSDNIVKLAEERLSSAGVLFHVDCISSRDLDEFDDESFDIVYSAFVLHHQSLEELNELIVAASRISKHSFFHLDLSRSFWGIIVIWFFYTFFAFRESRSDAVLSCQRAYRKEEIEQLIFKLNIDRKISVRRIHPLYWSIQKSFEGG